MYVQVEEKNFDDGCPICGSPDISIIKVYSNGIVDLTKYRCLTCLATFDICPDYERW
jgi:transposase-like protein